MPLRGEVPDMTFKDPVEALVAQALTDAGIGFVSDVNNPSRLDFRLENGIEIEVKRFHSPRIAEQMARAENVIAIQGMEAAQFFADLLQTKATQP